MPSLDTPVCDQEAKTFEARAEEMSGVHVFVISTDLPYAQKRWRDENDIDHISILSDHLTASFGRSYGVLIPERRILARAAFVIDRQGIVRFVQYVPKLNDQVDFEAIVAAARGVG